MRTSGGRLTGRTGKYKCIFKEGYEFTQNFVLCCRVFPYASFPMVCGFISATNTSYSIINIIGHEIKRRLLLGRKIMTNLDSLFKSRDSTLPTKVCLVKAMVFPVVMYGCESWTVKKAECRRIDAFELWCWRRLLRVPWTARRSNQSIQRRSALGFLWKE